MSNDHIVCHIFSMKKKSLLKTNIYLKNKKEREERILRTVLSPSKVEGIDISVDSIPRFKKNTTVKKNHPKQL